MRVFPDDDVDYRRGVCTIAIPTVRPERYAEILDRRHIFPNGEHSRIRKLSVGGIHQRDRNLCKHLIFKDNLCYPARHSCDATGGSAMRRKLFFAVVLFSALLFSYGKQVANSQQTVPKDNKGFKATVKQAVDLGPEIEGMKGRQLRLRVLTIEPGGYIGLHSHKDRPAVVYFLQGTDTVTSEGGTVKLYGPGDTSSATKDTTHWHRNDGKETVVLIAVDVFHNAP